MLLGRASEQARIEDLLAAARSGVSGALVIRGEPGIGKSALLRFGISQAEGMTVLSATGIESESELPFSGLSELLHPVLGLLNEIPEPQARALAGALAMGPPGAQDQFSISAATLSVLAAAAERQPILIVVDDAHWLDAASRDALLFAGRRLKADRILMLFAARAGESRAFDVRWLPELILQGIERDACEVLLQSAASNIPADVAKRILEVASGNPLAILEMPRALSPAQLSGHEPLADPLPAGPGIQRSFERRLASLPTQTQQALLVTAASRSGSVAEVKQACESLGSGLATLDPAEAAGLISSDGLRIQFLHPLLRAAVYHSATAPARRAVHRALAESEPANGSVAERAWHLAFAAQGEDATVASALEQAAIDARLRSGHAAAASAFERAARLSPDLEERARRLHQAGSNAYLAGESERAMRLLSEALSVAGGITLRADIEQTRGRIEMWTCSPAAARKILAAAADRVEAHDPGRAALMLVDATITYTQESDPDDAPHALAMAQRAYDLGRRVGGVPEAAAGGMLGKILVAIGQHAEARPLLIRSLEAIDEKESL